VRPSTFQEPALQSSLPDNTPSADRGPDLRLVLVATMLELKILLQRRFAQIARRWHVGKMADVACAVDRGEWDDLGNCPRRSHNAGVQRLTMSSYTIAKSAFLNLQQADHRLLSSPGLMPLFRNDGPSSYFPLVDVIPYRAQISEGRLCARR